LIDRDGSGVAGELLVSDPPRRLVTTPPGADRGFLSYPAAKMAA
jgi:hypothetical protein